MLVRPLGYGAIVRTRKQAACPPSGKENRLSRTHGNEGRCCDAVLRVLEGRAREVRDDLHVDPRGGAGAGHVDVCVRLGSDRYVLEHTRIDPFEDAIKIGIKFSDFVTLIENRLSGVLPGPAYHTLLLPQDLELGGKSRKQIATIQEALIDWISDEAPRLYDQAATSGLSQSHASAAGEFPGLLPYPANLSCFVSGPPSDTKAGRFSVARTPDVDLEEQRFGRVRRALAEKCPKLQRCKDRGARTVLVLECGDIALSNSVSIRAALNRAAEERADIPDEIYLVETKVETWHMWPMNPAAENAFPSDFNTECKAFESADLDDLMFQNAPEVQCDVCVGP